MSRDTGAWEVREAMKEVIAYIDLVERGAM